MAQKKLSITELKQREYEYKNTKHIGQVNQTACVDAS